MLKGKKFEHADLPKLHRLNPMQADEWCRQMTDRYKVVAMDGDMPVIAEELTERIVRRLDGDVRQMALMVLRLPVDKRLALFAAFDATGDLRNVLEAA